MRKRFGWRVRIPVAMLIVAVAVSIATTSTVFGKAHAAAAAVKCGMGTGKAATGSPIVLGAIAVNQPGTSFTDIPNMANAYFQCVNANGGINGHPIKLDILTDQTQPAQVAADAKQLINTDHVVGIVGSSDIIDCAVNGATYQKDGFNVIDAGIAQQCYASPWSAAVNMGPRFSGDGAAQTAIAHGAKTIVIDQSNVPGYQYNAAGIELIAKAHHVKVVSLSANASSLNGETEAERIVQAAGTGGAADLIFTPPVAQQILQGAQKLNLENKVIWTCATPCNTDSLAASLGPAWNHKLYVNAEMNDVHSDNGPEHQAVPPGAQGLRLGGQRRHRLVQPVRLHDRPDRHAGADVDQEPHLHEGDRQRRHRGRQGIQDRHALPALVLRQGAGPPAQQHRLHRVARERNDADRPRLRLPADLLV